MNAIDRQPTTEGLHPLFESAARRKPCEAGPPARRRGAGPATVIAGLAFACLALCGSPRPSEAWKPYTHSFAAEQARSDAADNGNVSINGREYSVRPEVVAALRDWPQFFNAGVIGPDGFPDATYGQAVIHPIETGKWLEHLFNKAWEAQSDASLSAEKKSQILAFTYGFLSHAAGDMWGHTLVNDFSGGVFPAWADVLSSVSNASIAVKHLLAEGYIGNATPGFDENPARGPAPNGDVSDDSTPAFAYDVPTEFVYSALIDPAADTPVPAVRGSYRDARGPLIGFFLELRDDLDDFVGDAPNPLQEALDEYDDTIACLIELKCACNFGTGVSGCDNACCLGFCTDGCDFAHDLVACPAGILECGFDFAVDSFEAFLAASEAIALDAAHLVLDSYLYAWVQDINDGLKDWGKFGLATTRGLFDPQARRDLQNEECQFKGDESSTLRAQCEDGIGIADVVVHETDGFVNDHLLSMLGLPDFVGEVRSIVGEIEEVFDDILGVIGIPFNPLLEAVADLKAWIKDLVEDLISEVLGIDIEELEQFLKSPSRFICLPSTSLTLPILGTVDLTLFAAGEHDRLDGILQLPDPHHVEAEGVPEGCGRLFDNTEFSSIAFAPLRNTVTMSKLLLLDGPQLDQVLSDQLGRTISTYQTGENVMVKGLGSETWLTLIDGDHSWRQDGLPVFGSRPAEVTGGKGTFPIWESCVMRPSFRTLFVDWENGNQNFPDLGDQESSDPVNDPNPPTSALARTGAFYDDGVHQFVAADNQFTHTAHDTPAGKAFPDEVLGLQHRATLDPSLPGAFVTTGQGANFSLVKPDGLYHLDIRSEDHCHTFDESDQTSPEPTKTSDYVLDSTPPEVTCATPPFGLTFDTDDFSNVHYSISDGTLGSGVASSSSTLDGVLVLPGVVSIANNALLDMYLLYPGSRTVAVTSADHLGNSGTSPCTFEVHATTQSLINNVKRARSEGKIKNLGVYNSLLATLMAADAARKRHDVTAELKALAAFVDQLVANRGDGVEAVTADRFIAYAKDLIARGG
jgi:hypothetical protein